MKHNRELNAYQKILELIFELNGDSDDKAIPTTLFLKKFNEYWNKYYAKEFRKSKKLTT